MKQDSFSITATTFIKRCKDFIDFRDPETSGMVVSCSDIFDALPHLTLPEEFMLFVDLSFNDFPPEISGLKALFLGNGEPPKMLKPIIDGFPDVFWPIDVVIPDYSEDSFWEVFLLNQSVRYFPMIKRKNHQEYTYTADADDSLNIGHKDQDNLLLADNMLSVGHIDQDGFVLTGMVNDETLLPSVTKISKSAAVIDYTFRNGRNRLIKASAFVSFSEAGCSVKIKYNSFLHVNISD